MSGSFTWSSRTVHAAQGRPASRYRRASMVASTISVRGSARIGSSRVSSPSRSSRTAATRGAVADQSTVPKTPSTMAAASTTARSVDREFKRMLLQSEVRDAPDRPPSPPPTTHPLATSTRTRRAVFRVNI
jgi:hypothetical protein